ncbi:MAG: putative spermidine/putrescine transport system substrate-binding protein [Rhodospirillaceae bacterium]|jgi:putative spermidine/putrescine transport system substrate-binding protein|nr:putative spermidine/putrescine transport system substrate-binding protein [Rhodospirillaceae bacterium]
MLSRRKLLTAGAGLGALSLVPAVRARRAFAQDRPLTFCSWGGALSATEKRAFMDPFAKLKGIEIANVSPTNYAKIKAMVEARAVDWDLVDVGGQFIYQGRDAHALEPIDYSIVKADHLEPYWRTEYGVYTSTGASVIAYSTKAFPTGSEPHSWKDFWNVKAFPGPRSLYSRFYYNYEAAARAAGVPRNEIYPATDEKVDLAFAKLAEIKPHVTVWWTAGAQPPQLLATGEVVMALAWSGRIFDAMREKLPVAMTFEDAIAWGNAYVVPKGTPYRERVMELISYCISQEAQERLLPIGTYGPALGSAAAKATPDQARNIVTHPDHIKDAVVFNDEEVSKYLSKWEDRWQKFQLS